MLSFLLLNPQNKKPDVIPSLPSNSLHVMVLSLPIYTHFISHALPFPLPFQNTTPTAAELGSKNQLNH